MKKLFLCVLTALLAVFGCLLVSCDTTNEEVSQNPEIPQNPLIGTTWAASSTSFTFWIKFTSETDFLEYMGDIDGNPSSSGIETGTYFFSNGKVYFLTHNSTSKFDYAIINGEMLMLTYKSGFQRTFIKKNY